MAAQEADLNEDMVRDRDVLSEHTSEDEGITNENF